MNKEEIINKQIELHTIAMYDGEEYELENLMNGILEKIAEKDKEIDRLNNAFDELEKYLIEGTKEPHYVSGDMFWDEACEIILNKLKGLRSK